MGWLKGVETFNHALALLFNGEAKDFCPQVNLSSALTKIIYSLSSDPARYKILLTEQDFPSMGFVANRAGSREYELQFIPNEIDSADLNCLG